VRCIYTAKKYPRYLFDSSAAIQQIDRRNATKCREAPAF
jgi:hypothetical protein